MRKQDLKLVLDEEISRLAQKTYAELTTSFADVVGYERGDKENYCQFEVQLLEHTPDYVHVCVSVDDGSFIRSFAPVTRGFLVYRDGRVEI